MMQSSATLIALNDKAVKLMQTGQLHAAVQVLSHALCLCKKEVMTTSSMDQDSEWNTCQSFSTVLIDLKLTLESASAFSIYSHAISVSVETTGYHAGQVALFPSCESLSLILLFNMALCYHIQGLIYGAEVKLFTKALKVYETLSNLIDSVDTTSSCETTRLLMLGIVNNIGRIHSSLFESEKEQQCLIRLKSLLDATKKADEEKSLSDFYLNVILLCGEQKRHASVA